MVAFLATIGDVRIAHDFDVTLVFNGGAVGVALRARHADTTASALKHRGRKRAVVAGIASDVSVHAAGDRKADFVGRQQRRGKRHRGVARAAVRANRALAVRDGGARRELRVALVALRARHRRTREAAFTMLHVAFVAWQRAVASRERKTAAPMGVDGEARCTKAVFRMATFALKAKLTRVRVLVATGAALRHRLRKILRVAARTRHGGVLAVQLKTGACVREASGRPTLWRMTSVAARLGFWVRTAR